jgi:hypothetical protein
MNAYRVTLGEFKRSSASIIFIEATNPKIQTIKRDIIVDNNQSIEGVVHRRYNTDTTFYSIESVKEINIYDINICDLTFGDILTLLNLVIDTKS